MSPHETGERRLGLRVLQVVTRGDEAGGAQQHVARLATCLDERGWDVELIAGSHEFFATAVPESVERVSISSLTRQLGLRHDFKALQSLTAHIRATRPDLVAAHSAKGTVLARVACTIARRPCVITYHGSPFTPGLATWRRVLGGAVEFSLRYMSRAQVFVSSRDHAAARKFKITRRRLSHLIPNGVVDISVDRPNEESERMLRIVMVARFSKPKDFGTLIEAFSQLDVPEVELVLVGDGPARPAMELLAQQLGVDARVRFLGSRSDVAEILGAADVFVLSSSYEGAPLTVLEALRGGVPVVASDVGDIGLMVRDGQEGFLVPRGDIDGFRLALKRLASDGELRRAMSGAARSRFETEFDERRMIDATELLYLQVLGRGPSRTGRFETSEVGR
jgi:glycosyltransferase involved in cell wall biosynthesis